jgi:hypothetical protein
VGGVVVSPTGIGVGEIVEKFKRYWWLVLCLWALLAFVSWHYESTCGMFFSSACLSGYWDGLRWIALLKWVTPYQTLLAGGFAVAGGAFALIAARHSTATTLALENSKNRQASIVACSIVADEFRDAVLLLSQTGGASMMFVQQSSPFIQTPIYAATLHTINPLLGSTVSAHRREIEEAIRTRSSIEAYRRIRIATAKCYFVWHMLDMISQRLDVTGKYNMNSTDKLPPGFLIEVMQSSDIRPKDLGGLYRHFNWSKT